MRGLLVALLCVLLAALTNVRVRVWQSDQALWADVVAKAPQNPRARYNLLVSAGRTIAPADWEQVRQAARRRWPQAVSRWAWTMASWQLGKAAATRNEVQEALRYFNDMERGPQ